MLKKNESWQSRSVVYKTDDGRIVTIQIKLLYSAHAQARSGAGHEPLRKLEMGSSFSYRWLE